MNVTKAEIDARLRIHSTGTRSETSSNLTESGVRNPDARPIGSNTLVLWQGTVEVNSTNNLTLQTLTAISVVEAGAPVHTDADDELDWEGNTFTATSLRAIQIDTAPVTAGQTGTVSITLADNAELLIPIGASLLLDAGTLQALPNAQWDGMLFATLNATWARVTVTLLAQTPAA